ncbi:MAG: alpha/beta fold hydrolase [Armatimonadota bacterium]
MITLCIAAVFVQAAAVADQGAYLTYQAGVAVAREGFRILDTGKSSALITRGETSPEKPENLLMKVEAQTKNGSLSSAVLNFGGGKTLEVAVGDGVVTMSDGTEVKFDTGRPLYLAENLVWHTLRYIFRDIPEDADHAEPQILVPTQRLVLTMSLSNKRIREDGLIEWTATTAGVQQTFVVDGQGNVLHITIPSQRAQVVRKGHETLMSAQPTLDPLELKPNASKYTEREVEVMTAANVYLKGTLAVPNSPGPKPAVLLISGSGPQDRDWNTPPVLTASLAVQIADRLAAEGCVVLRTDDRGVGGSTGDLSAATLSALVTDAERLADYLKALPEVDPFKVVVLGHSEGGVIAPMVAASDPTIAGVIILAGTSRPLDEIVIEQLKAQESDERLPQPVREEAARILPLMTETIARAKAGERGVVNGMSLAWLREHMKHDPRQTIAKLRCPILIVQGEDDLKVLPRNATELHDAALAAGNDDVTLEMIPGLTHLFTQFPFGNPAYDPSTPERISPRVLDALTSWLRERFLKDSLHLVARAAQRCSY